MGHKNIALLFSGSFPEGNTKNARLKIIALELHKHGWQSSFYSLIPNSFSSRKIGSQPKIWEDFSIKYFSLFKNYQKYFVFRLGQYFIAHICILVWSVFIAGRNDVLYFYCPRWTDTLLSLYINTLLGRKVIVDQTELFSSGGNSRWHRSEERIIAKNPNVLLVISNKLKAHFKLLRDKDTYLFPIIMDSQRFDLDVKECKLLMGYVGSFAPKDGIQELLEATKQLIKIYPEITLRLIGYNPNMLQLEEKVNAMGLQDNVEITGTVTYESIPRLLLECDTLLMNRDASIFSSYGYPIKLGEYFACKKPVLMSNGKGFSEDYEHRNQVYKYDVDNAKSLADAIIYRYEHPGESDAIAKRGYEYALDNFESEKTVQFLANILEEL